MKQLFIMAGVCYFWVICSHDRSKYTLTFLMLYSLCLPVSVPVNKSASYIKRIWYCKYHLEHWILKFAHIHNPQNYIKHILPTRINIQTNAVFRVLNDNSADCQLCCIQVSFVVLSACTLCCGQLEGSLWQVLEPQLLWKPLYLPLSWHTCWQPLHSSTLGALLGWFVKSLWFFYFWLLTSS